MFKPCIGMITVCLIVFLTPFQSPAFSEGEHTVVLKNRSFTPEPGISDDFVLDLETSEKEKHHAFVQLWGELEDETEAFLVSNGINLMFHVVSNTWVAVIDRHNFKSLPEMKERVRWIGEIKPGDKLGPLLTSRDYPDWGKTEEGLIRINIEFFAGRKKKRRNRLFLNIRTGLRCPGQTCFIWRKSRNDRYLNWHHTMK